jgi:hypothetical protein
MPRQYSNGLFLCKHFTLRDSVSDTREPNARTDAKTNAKPNAKTNAHSDDAHTDDRSS